MTLKIECAIQGCSRRTIGNAPWCVRHLRQLSVNGDPFATQRPADVDEPPAEQAPAVEAEPESTGRPPSATSARRRWEAYAVELGADADGLADLTKLELIELCDQLEAQRAEAAAS